MKIVYLCFVFFFFMWFEEYGVYLSTVSYFCFFSWKKWKCSKRVYSKNSFVFVFLQSLLEKGNYFAA